MLSIKSFSSSDAATNYYSHGDYYGSEGEGSWLGEGAKELGLSGNFTAKNNQIFNDLLHGILPGGEQLGRESKDGIKHRPGTDLTFSVPKSFSIQMMINSTPEHRKEMEAALMIAVNKTLSFIEKEGYVITRKKYNGSEIEKLDKLAFATFMHTTNRNLEPQVHMHCFLANVAICKDGKYRSITNDRLLENSKFFGQIFRNELALETKKLGHEINTTILSDGSSAFELTSIHPKMIEAFSTRRKEIVELCKQYGITTKEGRDKIVINSRKAKKLVTQEELSKTWHSIKQHIQKEIDNEQKSQDINQVLETQVPCSLVENIKSKLENLFIDKKEDFSNNETMTAKDLVTLAGDNISNGKTVFTQEELLKISLKHAMGSYSVSDLKNEMKNLEKSGALIRHENQLTTKALLDKEKQILKFVANSIGTANPIIKENKFNNHLSKFESRQNPSDNHHQMNPSQTRAIKHILTSNDKIITMEGLPGVGKSTVLNAVRDISGRKIINLIGSPFGLGEKFQGSAPTASAAKTLQESAKVQSQTLHSFLGKYSGYIEDRGTKGSLNHIRQEYKNAVIFVDEASLISTNMMHRLLKLQSKLEFRLVLTGDTKQLESVEAGKPFEQMLEIIKPIKLKEIVRQKDESHREAVISTCEGRIDKTFNIHEKNISQASVANLAKNAADLYLTKNHLQRNNTLIISPTRALRDQINNEIRIGLQKEHSLIGKEINFTALARKDMRASDYNFAYSYNEGDIIKFNKNYKNGINQNDYLKVKSINKISNSLLLEKNGKNVIFNLSNKTDYSNKFEVFQEKNLQLQEGLKIIFTKNNKQHGLINSETATIEKINHNSAAANVTLKLEDGGLKSVPLSHLKHIDYGYSVTVHSAQGKTFDHTIAAISNNKLLSTQKMWLVALSRHKSSFTAFVEDKDKLKSYLIHNSGSVVSATELQSKIDSSNISQTNEAQPTPKIERSRGMREMEIGG
jgi:conjugative relaxase-like TrwC/TraI family protein